MANYPGSQILFEVGTRKDLAKIYGVSERTIYRWLNKAAAESGAPRVKKSNKPSTSKLSSFKGTRKQAAQKFGVSERTIYRWLKDAKLSGTTTTQKAKYFGPDILNLKGTNKQLAEQFGVSDRTISRWKAKARMERLAPDLRKTGQWKKNKNGAYEYIGDQQAFEQQISEAYNPEFMEAPPEIEDYQPYEEPIEGFDQEDYQESFEWEEDYQDYDISKKSFDNLKFIDSVIFDQGLSSKDSIFSTLTFKERIIYINNYIQYQYDQDPKQFYDTATHQFRFDAEWVTQYVDIWGDEFDNWCERQFNSDMYEI